MEKLSEFLKTENSKILHFIRKNLDETDIEDAEDILQDVMLKIVRLDIADSIENLTAYIYRSIKNRIIDMYRKPDRTVSMNAGSDEESSLEDTLTDNKFDVDSGLKKNEIEERISEALEKINPIYRDVFIATEMDGYTFQELSDMWDEPVGTLLSRKHRALSLLQDQLKDLK